MRIGFVRLAVLGLAPLSACASMEAAPIESAPAPRLVAASVVVAAPPAEVWADWTEAERIDDFFAVGGAVIEPRAGGAYWIYMLSEADAAAMTGGLRGSDDSEIIAYQPTALLSYTWRMPPYMPEIRPHLTHVTMRFSEKGHDATLIELEHGGFGDGAAWDEGLAYFERAWPSVLARYAACVQNWAGMPDRSIAARECS